MNERVLVPLDGYLAAESAWTYVQVQHFTWTVFGGRGQAGYPVVNEPKP